MSVGLQDDWNILRAEKIFDFVGFGAAGEDHFQFLLVAEFDGVADIAGFVGEDQDRKFAAGDRERELRV